MCPECEKEQRVEDKKVEESLRRVNLERKVKDAGVPTRFMECSFENYRRDNDGQRKAGKLAEEYLERFTQGKVSDPLFLLGTVGTGKTHLAIAILIKLLTDEIIRSGKYTTTMKMLRDIRSSYNHGSDRTEQQIINSYTNVDLLVLDEVGVQYGTDGEKLLIYEVLNGRYEEMKPTVIIANLPYPELEAYMGKRVMDRLKGEHGTMAIFNWESERGKHE